MGKLEQFSVTEVTSRPSLFTKALPFQITAHGKVVAEVVYPGSTKWKECENCKKDTQNVISFKDDQDRWHQLILCDECQEKLL